MARRPAPRLHRLPQRLDYTLIPAPLDLSLPLIAEKSPLPAIIVTPSSPSATHDYSIAFLAPPPKPTLIERITSTFSSPPALPPTPASPLPSTPTTPSKAKAYSLRVKLTRPVKAHARTLLILSLILFVMICHLITHKLAMRRPHLAFSAVSEGGVHIQEPQGWFALGMGAEDVKMERDFIVVESSGSGSDGVEGISVDGKIAVAAGDAGNVPSGNIVVDELELKGSDAPV